ncbi:uncharacterized protein LOC128207231, partial [Mya arenaria]|uniref:uncharacterized protein LOC128207231 n=1 Tax=Mya arenaria TaxID=6604 RepID=UPI0022E86471
MQMSHMGRKIIFGRKGLDTVDPSDLNDTMDSYDGQQHILSNDNDSKVELVDTAARQKENMAQWASHMQYQSVDLKNEDALLKSDQGKLVPSQTPPEAGLRDELLRERARLQKLVKERDQLKETRRLQKEIEELRRQLDDIDLADIGKPAESKFSPRSPENILECPASESHIRKIDINMPNEMTNSEPALRDELLHERARLQRLVEEHHKLLETRVLRKEIKELYRLLDDVEVVDMWNPVIPEYGTRTHDHVQDLRAIESLDENVNLNDFTDSLEDDPQGGTNQDAVDVESKDGTLTVPRTIYSRINGQGATEEHIKPDEVPGHRHESFSEKEDSEVSGGHETQKFDAYGTFKWLRRTLPDISTYNRRSMKGVMRYITILKNEGMSYMQNAIQNDLDGWKHMEFSVALVGDAGAGKSSLINAILGLTADDKGAA